jgi:hypothetical protein
MQCNGLLASKTPLVLHSLLELCQAEHCSVEAQQCRHSVEHRCTECCLCLSLSLSCITLLAKDTCALEYHLQEVLNRGAKAILFHISHEPQKHYPKCLYLKFLMMTMSYRHHQLQLCYIHTAITEGHIDACVSAMTKYYISNTHCNSNQSSTSTTAMHYCISNTLFCSPT